MRRVRKRVPALVKDRESLISNDNPRGAGSPTTSNSARRPDGSLSNNAHPRSIAAIPPPCRRARMNTASTPCLPMSARTFSVVIACTSVILFPLIHWTRSMSWMPWYIQIGLAPLLAAPTDRGTSRLARTWTASPREPLATAPAAPTYRARRGAGCALRRVGDLTRWRLLASGAQPRRCRRSAFRRGRERPIRARLTTTSAWRRSGAATTAASTTVSAEGRRDSPRGGS